MSGEFTDQTGLADSYRCAEEECEHKRVMWNPNRAGFICCECAEPIEMDSDFEPQLWTICDRGQF